MMAQRRKSLRITIKIAKEAAVIVALLPVNVIVPFFKILMLIAKQTPKKTGKQEKKKAEIAMKLWMTKALWKSLRKQSHYAATQN